MKTCSVFRLQSGPCLCLCVCYVCILSLLVHPNNSPTLINIVCRSLRPAVSGPAAWGSGSDIDEWSSVQCSEHIPGALPKPKAKTRGTIILPFKAFLLGLKLGHHFWGNYSSRHKDFVSRHVLAWCRSIV